MIHQIDFEALREEKERLEKENKSLTAKLASATEVLNELFLELGSKGPAIDAVRALKYTVDQSKNDVAQLAAMCNEIVKLRELLEEARKWLPHVPMDTNWSNMCRNLEDRIDAALEKE